MMAKYAINMGMNNSTDALTYKMCTSYAMCGSEVYCVNFP